MNSLSLPTIIVPVYNALDELKVCLSSLHRTIPSEAEVLLLDDASDNAGIEPLLRHWVDRVGPAWRLEVGTQNRGFVATVNRGMQLTRGNVVLLNSDTLLTPGWLQGLQRCLDSDDTIATATPWTNNGEIASIPQFCQANPIPADPDAIAVRIRASGQPAYPEIPTAVGFCMAVSRDAINRLGLFDQELFGLGYGEENDFSMRASKAGMKNVLCDDVFVGHVGGSSFAPRGLRPDENAMNKLLSRHPDYLLLIQEFIDADPLEKRRSELVLAVQAAGIEWTWCSI